MTLAQTSAHASTSPGSLSKSQPAIRDVLAQEDSKSAVKKDPAVKKEIKKEANKKAEKKATKKSSNTVMIVIVSIIVILGLLMVLYCMYDPKAAASCMAKFKK